MNEANAEQRVIRQLIEALLFESICSYNYRAGHFYFTLAGFQYRVNGKISGFSRIRLNAHAMQFFTEETWQPIVLSTLLKHLPVSLQVKQKLTTELNQTIKLCQWNDKNLTRPSSRRTLPYSQLESALDEGHPYHPCFKARTGFNENDHQTYGPESANLFQLHWLAVRRCNLKRRFNSVPEHIFWQQELGDAVYQQLQKILVKQTDDCSAFSLMPIHPWQWDNLKENLVTAMTKKELYYLGAAGDFYQASISVRTLLNISNPEKANIKLPLNVVNTSSLRTIESHSICTAPILSQWLNELKKSDPYLQKNMILLSEYAGIRIVNDGVKTLPWIDILDGHFGVIFRESLTQYCAEDTVVPYVALTVIEQDNKPFIDPWIKQHGCESWLKQLIKQTVIPVWHLLVHHGIAVEAHGQNMLLQHRDGWPEKVILRDFHESLEYVHDYLAKPNLAPIFGELEDCYNTAKPNQYYWMSGVEGLRELFVDTLFVFNLADLSVLLEEHYQFEEQYFWQLIYQCFEHYQDSGITAKKRIVQLDIFQSSIQTESLLKKKLTSDELSEFHHSVDNPIAAAQKSLQRPFSNEQSVVEKIIC